MTTMIDVTVWRGNDAPLIAWAWPDGYTAGPNCQLTVWVGGEFAFSADGGVDLILDSEGRRFLWAPSLDQSRLVPFGRIARYEIEDRYGGEMTIFAGFMAGAGGLNLDDGTGSPEGALIFSHSANSGQDLDGWV